MRSVLVALLVSLALAGSPAAFAKTGHGKSFGSRGSKTYSRPMERSAQPPMPTAAPRQPVTSSPLPPPAAAPVSPPPAPVPPVPAGGAAGPGPGAASAPPTMPFPAPLGAPGAIQTAPSPAAASGLMGRRPFLAGLVGGFAGAGLAGLVLGQSSAMAGYSQAAPAASLLGVVLQLAVLAGLVWLAVGFFRRRATASAAAAVARTRDPVRSEPVMGRPREFEPSDQDRQAFERILIEIQGAWTRADIPALSALTTPEVTSYLVEDLSRDRGRGIANRVEGVRLLKGEIDEAWREDDVDYVTAILTFESRDYSVQAGSGKVVEGNPATPTVATESWTFLRAAQGRWLLSAIERG